MATFLPTFPALSSGAIFIKGFANNSASTATVAEYVTFAHCFQKGQIASGGGVEANIGGTVYPCQLDVKTSYADGSVCYAVISMQVPAIAASTTVWGQFSPAAPPGGAALSLASAIGATTLSIALAASTLPNWAANTAYAQGALIKPATGNAGGYIFQAMSAAGTSGATAPTWTQTQGTAITDNTETWNNSGVPFSGTITQDLIAAVKNSTDLWLSGPLAVQGRAYILPANPGSLANATVNSALPAMLRVVIDLTAYKDGTVLADVCVANDCYATLQTTGQNVWGGTQAYAATLTLNGSNVFTSAALVHNAQADWAWQAGTVPHLVASSQDLVLQIVHNPADFIEAQAIIPYDCTIGVGSDGNGDAYVTDAAGFLTDPGFAQPLTDPGPAGGTALVNPNMPDVGVSWPEDGPGPNCFWQAWWLTTQNVSFYGTGLEAAKVNGYVPWHTWNPNTGSYWTTDDDPKLNASQYWQNNRGHFVPVQTADRFWQIDGEHYPDLVYIACLFTGRRYFLDQLVATANYFQQNDTWSAGGYASIVWGQTLFFYNLLTCRTQGWGFRHTLYATYLCPDGTMQKKFFRKIVDNNLYWALGNFAFYQSRQGECYGWLPANYGGNYEIAPWQDDYAFYVVGLAATMGHPLALQLAWWMLHFRTGILLNGSNWPPDGYPAADAVIYDIMIRSAVDPNNFWYQSHPMATSWEGLEQLVRLSSFLNAGSSTASNTANVVFQGTLATSGALTVTSVTGGALAIGMSVYSAAGNIPFFQITGGSGTSWTTNYTGAQGAYTGYMSASNYNEPGQYIFWWGGTGGGGGNLDDYAPLLYDTLIQGEILGHPLAASALSTLTGLVDATGAAVPNVTSTTSWQNALVMRLASRTWNDSQIFPAAGAAPGNQGQSFGLLGAVASAVPGAPVLAWMPSRRKRVYFGNRR